MQFTTIYLDHPRFNDFLNSDSKRLNTLSPIKKINMFVGANNSGKSRLLRFIAQTQPIEFNDDEHRLDEYMTGFKAHTLDIIDYIRKSNWTAVDTLDISTLDKYANFPFRFSESHDFFQDIPQSLRNWLAVQHFMLFKDNNGSQQNISNKSETTRDIKESLSAMNSIIDRIPTRTRDDTFERYYIPITRGLRTLGDMQPIESPPADQYGTITKKDYFNDSENVARVNIFSGLTFFDLLVKLLLGNSNKRSSIKDYQSRLSQSLFDGKEVTLIPHIESRTVWITLGEEDEQPVHRLGDGLQSAIILSFLPLTTENHSLFFIEEPEIHLHPGLQRKVLDLFSRTPHTFFLTTHSNHLLDITLDFDTSIFTFNKLVDQTSDQAQLPNFVVESMTFGSRNALELLGVRNSSAYLVNATIWVEGFTDRFYIRNFLLLYIKHLESTGAKHPSLFKPSEDIHFAFVEYSGSNIDHWSFSDIEDGQVSEDEVNETDDKSRINAKRLCSKSLVIIDKDGDSKLERKEELSFILGDRLVITDCHEIENLLPPFVIQSIVKYYESTKDKDFTTPNFEYKSYQHQYLGQFIEDNITYRRKGGYKELSGTVKDKRRFCELALHYLKDVSFNELPPPAQSLTITIYEFVAKMNGLQI